jgi:hypothetical protein
MQTSLCKLLVLTVDAMEVLIKYCMNSFPEVDQFKKAISDYYTLKLDSYILPDERRT